MIETIKAIVADMLNLQQRTQHGTITAYNPEAYTVKVNIEPNGPETGWIQLAAAWSGNNLGAVFGPPIGTPCRVDFVDGKEEVSLAGGRFFNVNNRPPVVQSGQGAIVDGAGSYVRLNNDGTITIGASTGITSTTPLLKQVGNLEIDGNVVASGNANIGGNVLAVGTIADDNAAHGTLADLRSTYDIHTHVKGGGGSTDVPSQTI